MDESHWLEPDIEILNCPICKQSMKRKTFTHFGNLRGWECYPCGILLTDAAWKQLSNIIGSAATEAVSEKTREALREVQKYNRLSTELDADAYLVAITNWGLGEHSEKPNPEDYGIELEEQQT